ncbi:MAG TPA: hypothetical protein VFN10_22545 [Thermoanaerobaculia bacterium]|nr:hypothetical protein [Thermoanaerobaculia bacterium]
MTKVAEVNELGHKKPRYSFQRACRELRVGEKKLREWMRYGVLLATGRREPIHYIPLGPRQVEFEVEELERIYQCLRTSSVEAAEADVLPFPDEQSRVARRAHGKGRSDDDE